VDAAGCCCCVLVCVRVCLEGVSATVGTPKAAWKIEVLRADFSGAASTVDVVEDAT